MQILVRDWLNKHPRSVSVVMVLVIVGIVIFITRSHKKDVRQIPFVDDQSLEEIMRPATDAPPVEYKGHTLVKGYYCLYDGKRELIYLEKYTPDGKTKAEEFTRKMDSGQPVSPFAMMALGSETLVRLPKPGSPWTPANSSEGQTIRLSALQRPGALALPE